MTPARGFSLIELLVAISLIAILIGILLPTLSLARDRGRSAACMGHLRNFGQVMAMYYHDYDDVFPVARHMPPPLLTGDTDPPSVLSTKERTARFRTSCGPIAER